MADDKKKKKKSKDMMSGLGGIFDVAPQPEKEEEAAEEEVEETPEEESAEESEEVVVEEEAAEDADADADEDAGSEEEDAASDAAAELEAMKARVAELELEAAKAKVAELEAKAGKSADADEDAEPKKAEKKAEKKPEPKKAEKKPEEKKKPASAIDGVFSPGDDGGDVDLGDDDPFLGEDDLDGYEPRKTRGTTGMLVGIIALVLIALVAGLASAGFGPNDVALVLKGEYRQHKLAEKKRIEDEYRQKQLDALEKYGNLLMLGNPKYAQIKLNGELQYGEMSSPPNTFREVHLEAGMSNFQNLRVKEKLTIEVSSPGFDTQTFEVTEGKWQGEDVMSTFMYQLTATLVPSTPFNDSEFKARMSSDIDNEYYGEITLNSIPAGATVMFNNHPLLDKDGNALKTPVTFAANYVKDEKTGKLEERLVQVDTTIDRGHKIEVFMEGSELPRYATQLNRPMWTCEPKPEAEIKKLAEDASPQLQCNYKFAKTVDLDGIKRFKEKREEERKAIEAENEKIRKLQAEALGEAGVPSMSANDPTKDK